MSSLQKNDKTLKVLWNKAEKGDERFVLSIVFCTGKLMINLVESNFS